VRHPQPPGGVHLTGGRPVQPGDVTAPLPWQQQRRQQRQPHLPAVRMARYLQGDAVLRPHLVRKVRLMAQQNPHSPAGRPGQGLAQVGPAVQRVIYPGEPVPRRHKGAPVDQEAQPGAQPGRAREVVPVAEHGEGAPHRLQYVRQEPHIVPALREQVPGDHDQIGPFGCQHLSGAADELRPYQRPQVQVRQHPDCKAFQVRRQPIYRHLHPLDYGRSPVPDAQGAQHGGAQHGDPPHKERAATQRQKPLPTGKVKVGRTYIPLKFQGGVFVTMATTKRVFSGMQPSGSVTLGNYLGAMRNFVKLQHEAECYFCVVDLHAQTVPQNPQELYHNTLNLARIYVAAGIDPTVSTIFVQSHVSAHAEFGWLMECTSYVGEMERMTQYKDKSAKAEVVTTGLLTYPALMAGDILLYQATHVPVGEDQKQHLELTRDLATRINHRFKEALFTVPEPYIPARASGGRIMSLQDPTKKMSKSDDPNSAILLLDKPEVARKKIMRAVTDLGSEVKYDPENKPGVSNLMVILSLITGESLDSIGGRYTGYGQFKKDVAEAVISVLEPLQARVQELSAPLAIEEILEAGAQKAEQVAIPNLRLLQTKLGMVPRRGAR
jgi:tryptophanyl-tRNA synthetase